MILEVKHVNKYFGAKKILDDRMLRDCRFEWRRQVDAGENYCSADS